MTGFYGVIPRPVDADALRRLAERLDVGPMAEDDPAPFFAWVYPDGTRYSGDAVILALLDRMDECVAKIDGGAA